MGGGGVVGVVELVEVFGDGEFSDGCDGGEGVGGGGFEEGRGVVASGQGVSDGGVGGAE